MANKILDQQAALLRPAKEGAQVSSAAMAAPALAAANIGKAVTGLGDKGFQIATQIQERKNAGHMADLRRQMREHRAEWERDTMPGTPPEQRLEAWQKAAEQFQGHVTQQEMPPAVRSVFEQTYNDFQGGAGLEIQAGAYAEMDRASVEQGTMAADSALAGGDLQTAHEEIDAIPRLPTWKKEKIKSDMTKRHEYDSLMAGARDGTLDENQEKPGTMNENDFKRVMQTNAIGRRRNQATIIDGLLNDPNIETVDRFETELETYKDELTPVQMEKARKNFKSTIPLSPGERNKYRDAFTALEERRPNMTADEYEQAYYDTSAELAVEGTRIGARDLREILGGMSPDSIEASKKQALKTKKDWAKQDTRIIYGRRLAKMKDDGEIEDDLADVVRDQAELYFERGMLQATEEQTKDPAYVEKVRKAAWNEAVGTRGEGQGATADDVIFGPGEGVSATPGQRGVLPPKNSQSTLRGGN